MADRTPSTVTSYEQREQWLIAVLGNGDISDGAARTAARIQAHMNMQSGLINPSNATLARGTAQTERAVFKHLRDLERAGYISWVKVGGRGSHRYTLTLPFRNGGSYQASADQNGGSGISCDADRNGGARSPERITPLSGTPVPPNLRTLNLSGGDGLREIIAALRDRSKDWLWNGARFHPPATIVFANRHRWHEATRLHGVDFENAGLTASWSDAA